MFIINENWTISTKNLLKVLTFPGDLILNRGMYAATYNPFIKAQTFVLDPAINKLTKRLPPTEAL